MKIFGIVFTIIFLFTGVLFADIEEGLVAYYPFNGNANDESGHENHCVVSGATLDNDRFGNAQSAFSFDGVDDYIENKNPNDYLDLSNYSWVISSWIKTTETDYDKKIVHRFELGSGSNTNSGSYALSARSASNNNAAYFSVSVGNNETGVGVGDATLSVNISDGNWHHIVGVLDRNSSKIEIFVDGLLKSSKIITLEGDTPNSTAPFEIGRKYIVWGSPHGYFLGLIDDIRIYNRLLSESEIKQLYNEGIQDCVVNDDDNDGVPDQWDECKNTPQNSWVNKKGCHNTDLRYTEEDMLDIVNYLLKWDTNKDKQIGLIEAIHILKDTAILNNEPQ